MEEKYHMNFRTFKIWYNSGRFKELNIKTLGDLRKYLCETYEGE